MDIDYNDEFAKYLKPKEEDQEEPKKTRRKGYETWPTRKEGRHTMAEHYNDLANRNNVNDYKNNQYHRYAAYSDLLNTAEFKDPETSAFVRDYLETIPSGNKRATSKRSRKGMLISDSNKARWSEYRDKIAEEIKQWRERKARDIENKVENKPEEVIKSDLPEPIKEEARQVVKDDDKRNDEANNKVINDNLPIRKTKPNSDPDSQRLGLNFTDEDRLNWNKGKDRKVGDYTLDEWNVGKKPLSDDFESVDDLSAYLDENYPEEPLDEQLEDLAENEPEVAEQNADIIPETAEEAEQTTDGDARTNEANNEEIDKDKERLAYEQRLRKLGFSERDIKEALTLKYGSLDDYNNLDKSMHSDPVHANYDPRFEELNKKQEEEKAEEEEEVEDVFDPGLEDQNQYQEDRINGLDETMVNESMANAKVNDDLFEQAPELPYADNVLQMKRLEKKEVPEEEEAKAKEKSKLNISGPDLARQFKGGTVGGVSGGNSPNLPNQSGSSTSSSVGIPKAGLLSSSGGLTSPKIASHNIANGRTPDGSRTIGSSASKAPIPERDDKADHVTVAGHSNGGTLTSGPGAGMFKLGMIGRGGNIRSISNALPSGGKAGSTATLEAPNLANQSNTDINMLSLKDEIIQKSRNWPDNKLSEDGILIVVRQDGEVYINRNKFENFINLFPNEVSKIRKVVDES